jgi:hypothetical protein
MDYFAHAGKLAAMLMGGHHEVAMDPASWQRLANWMDLNAQYYGSYWKERVEDREITPDGEKALRTHVRQVFGPALAAEPIYALVNPPQPDESRILKAPLPVCAGGWGQFEPSWQSTNDAGYVRMYELVQSALEPKKEPERGERWILEARGEHRRRTRHIVSECSQPPFRGHRSAGALDSRHVTPGAVIP